MTKKTHVVSKNFGSVKYRFPNGYGASVIQHGYGSEEGYYEIAVLKYHSNSNESSTIDYTTPITDNVIGWVHADDIDKHLSEIESL
jgi:hypothetical protein